MAHAVVEILSSSYRDLGHALHCVASSDNSVFVTEPIGQSLQLSWPASAENLPVAQARHPVVSSGECFPASHSTHIVDPSNAACVPATQLVQLSWSFSSLNRPMGQRAHSFPVTNSPGKLRTEQPSICVHINNAGRHWWRALTKVHLPHTRCGHRGRDILAPCRAHHHPYTGSCPSAGTHRSLSTRRLVVVCLLRRGGACCLSLPSGRCRCLN
jgi:hypothetical protein